MKTMILIFSTPTDWAYNVLSKSLEYDGTWSKIFLPELIPRTKIMDLQSKSEPAY